MRCHLVLSLAIAAAACGGQRSEAQPSEPPGALPTEALGKGEELPPGVDLKGVDEFGRKLFFRVVSSQPSACGKAQSLLESARRDPACRRSLFGVRYVAKLVKAGLVESEITELVEKRYAAKPKAVIDLGRTPVQGDPTAPIVLVEFADFECPHCKLAGPVLKRVLEQYKGQVKLYFKNFPLKLHTHARDAALATVAAGRQGKFFAMHDKLFANQDKLDRPSIERYAQELGLDLPRFRADWVSKETADAVDRDRAEGERLELDGTPALFLDGREYTDPKTFEELKDWIDEAIELNR